MLAGMRTLIRQLRSLIEDEQPTMPDFVADGLLKVVHGNQRLSPKVIDWLKHAIKDPKFSKWFFIPKKPIYRGLMLDNTEILDEWTKGGFSRDRADGMLGSAYKTAFTYKGKLGECWSTSQHIAQNYSLSNDDAFAVQYGGNFNGDEFNVVVRTSAKGANFVGYTDALSSELGIMTNEMIDHLVINLEPEIRCTGLAWCERGEGLFNI